MTWLPPVQDRPDDVRCQARHPEHFTDPSWLKPEAAGKFRRVSYLAGVNHLLPVESLADGADQGQIKRGCRSHKCRTRWRHDPLAGMASLIGLVTYK